MRSALAALQGQRCRFEATYAGRSRKGHVILRDVLGPACEAEHIWVKRQDWSTRLPRPGHRIELVGTVMPYWHEDGRKDYNLIACREVRP